MNLCWLMLITIIMFKRIWILVLSIYIIFFILRSRREFRISYECVNFSFGLKFVYLCTYFPICFTTKYAELLKVEAFTSEKTLEPWALAALQKKTKGNLRSPGECQVGCLLLHLFLCSWYVFLYSLSLPFQFFFLLKILT